MCHFPIALKLAKITPLHKGESVLSVLNYRPISLIPIFSKLFERLVYNQFISYIQENKILDDLQFGFQKNVSIENAISSITTNISRAFTPKKSSYCIFLDFAKAFDTVNQCKESDTSHIQKLSFGKNSGGKCEWSSFW